MEILYEDNHIIIVNKRAGDIVQADKTGDKTLADEVKQYIKAKYAKPGAVFLGVAHRLDRPVSGAVVFARTSKALARLNEMFRTGRVRKTYHAIVPSLRPAVVAGRPVSGEWISLRHWITRNERQNRSYASCDEVAGGKLALLDYRTVARADRYDLLEVRLHTGRHHQIRCQLAAVGRVIRGDLKYGAPRSNPDGSICLHARHVEFEHPVSHVPVAVTAPYPPLSIWHVFDAAGIVKGRVPHLLRTCWKSRGAVAEKKC